MSDGRTCFPPCRLPKTHLKNARNFELRGSWSTSMGRNIALATRVRVTAGGKSILATLASSEAARDFASLLPLRLAMNDLFRREKSSRPYPEPYRKTGREHTHTPSGPSVTGRRDLTWQ